MNNLHGSGFDKGDFLRGSGPRRAGNAVIGLAAANCLLSAIPPERVGLDGEYDHSGLAKRVDRDLRQALGDTTVDQLEIAQRGKVVIFCGQSLDARLVRQITRLTLEIEGADFVEIVDRTSVLPQVA
jgi:hypothetical protein